MTTNKMNYDPLEPSEYLAEYSDSKNCWLQTYSGKKFHPLDPHAEDIDINDAAHSLSMLCRFTGHTRYFYSVAQHCVLVSYVCDKKNALFGLLHDLSEAYLTDLPSPLKNSGKFENYKKYESKLQSMIYNKFCGSDIEPADVKLADIQLLATEARDLMGPLHHEWTMPVKPLPFTITPLLPPEAEKLFLERFNELYTGK